MCGLFIDADDSLWKSSTRSMRVDGVVTSIRLEKFFWLLLEEISIRDNLSVAQLTTKLYLEAIDAEHDIANFTSFLRVCCSRYLSLVADKQLARDELTPLSDIQATSILDTEAKNLTKRQQDINLQRASSTTIN